MPAPSAKPWEINLSHWTMKEVQAWQDAFGNFRFADMTQIMTTVIKAWEFEGDPTDSASYAALAIPQYRLAMRKVAQALGDFFLQPL